MPTLAAFTRALKQVSQIETNPEVLVNRQCPLCQYDPIGNGRIYLADGGKQAVVVCQKCGASSFRDFGIRTMEVAKYHQQGQQMKAGSPQLPNTLFAQALCLAKAVRDSRDLRGLEDDGCALCDNCWDDDQDLMAMCSLNAEGELEHYVMVCSHCGPRINRDDNVVLLTIAEFRTRILAHLV